MIFTAIINALSAPTLGAAARMDDAKRKIRSFIVKHQALYYQPCSPRQRVSGAVPAKGYIVTLGCRLPLLLLPLQLFLALRLRFRLALLLSNFAVLPHHSPPPDMINQSLHVPRLLHQLPLTLRLAVAII
jgi:hypothetical protein